MARKKRQSGAEDFMDLVALLPWWGGVALAVLSCVVLHALSVPAKPVALQQGQLAGFVQGAMVASLAFAAQFAIPLLCVVAAVVSYLRRHKRQALIGQVTQSRGADVLNGMSWREFELLVGGAFRLRGYKVAEQGGASADGGGDLVLRKDGETFLVRCKQWKASRWGRGHSRAVRRDGRERCRRRRSCNANIKRVDSAR